MAMTKTVSTVSIQIALNENIASRSMMIHQQINVDDPDDEELPIRTVKGPIPLGPQDDVSAYEQMVQDIHAALWADFEPVPDEVVDEAAPTDPPEDDQEVLPGADEAPPAE